MGVALQALQAIRLRLAHLLQPQAATVAALALEQEQLAGLVAVVRVLMALQTALAALERQVKDLRVALARRRTLSLAAAVVLLP